MQKVSEQELTKIISDIFFSKPKDDDRELVL